MSVAAEHLSAVLLLMHATSLQLRSEDIPFNDDCAECGSW